MTFGDTMKHLISTLLCAAAIGLALPAAAQDAFPSRAITIVVPFGPGSGTDIGARLLAQKLSEAMGQTVTVDNKPGANGSIAAEFVARAKPDGYTLVMGTNSTHGANPALLKEMRYDPIKNFEPVTRVAIFSSVIVTTPSLPVKNLRELIALGKSQELTLAVGNASGTVMGETLARQVGWKLLRVPFRSNPPAMTEVVAGRVNMMFTDIASAKGLLTAGSVRPIAVTTIKRSALMPDVPTVAESGVPDYDLSGWIALYAPAGTPKAVVDRLNAEVTKTLQLPDVRTRLLDLGAEPAPLPVAEFAAWTQGEVNKWTRLVKEAGIQPE
jgi:tripartite-type tricarboxylate transporter receptor subunit TctC